MKSWWARRADAHLSSFPAPTGNLTIIKIYHLKNGTKYRSDWADEMILVSLQFLGR